MLKTFRQHGTTLIELIISIVVIGIALSGILLVMNQNIGASANPLIQHQAIAIGEAYLEEILEKPFVDPQAPDGEANRNQYDDIDDYNAIVAQIPRDQDGNAIAGLGNYSVTVSVVNEAIGPVGNQAPSGQTFRVTVSVLTPTNSNVQISGYRINF